MTKPTIIDLLRTPDAIKEGDVVAFNNFPGLAAGQVRGSSGLDTGKFKFNDTKPMYRAYVLGVVYDSRHQDKPTALILMPLAPVKKDVRLENDWKNLMLTRKGQIGPMGLNTDCNWRLNYMPFTAELTPKNFGLKEGAKVVRLGRVPAELDIVIMEQVKKLHETGALHTMNLLPPSLARELRGREIGCYDIIAGTEAQVAVRGNMADARGAAQADANKAEAFKEEKRKTRAEELETLKQEMRSTPSGTLAFALKLRFGKAASPDISLETAYERDFIDEDTLMFVNEIKDELGVATLRTAYDAFVGRHAEVLDVIAGKGLCDGDPLPLKATLESAMKNGLTSFYKALQSQDVAQRNELRSVTVPYEPAPAP